LPSGACIRANVHALARYAALCQEQELVPIVEPEVLMDGSHSIGRCEEATGAFLHRVFNALREHGVGLEVVLLKPNMVTAGQECPDTAAVDEVAVATLRCLRRHVPAAVPGIVFLSGGQDGRPATTHLSAINRLPESKPWTISFSYGRALQDQALEAWHGNDENLAAGQRALYQRARCNGAACHGVYTNKLEETPFVVRGAPDQREWRDD
jgi:fructose-bisphosphate aldolase, class I